MARKILALGDSITFGAWDPSGGWVARIKSHAHERWIATGADDDYAQVHNLGVPGDTSTDLLGRARVEVFSRSLRDPMPTTAVILIGTNDLKRPDGGAPQVSVDRYRENLETLVQHMRTPGDGTARPRAPLADHILLAGVPPVAAAANARSLDDVRVYAAAMAEVAAALGVEHLPLLATLDDGDLCEDGVHPNERGHRKLADLIGARVGLA